MYIFNPTLGKQVPFHCEGTLKKILDWNERPLNPHHGLKGELDSPRHDFDAWFWDEKRGKNRDLFLSKAYTWIVRGNMQH